MGEGQTWQIPPPSGARDELSSSNPVGLEGLRTPSAVLARVERALALALQSGPDIPIGDIDNLSKEESRQKCQELDISSQHRAWVIDQMVRTLTGDGYTKFIEQACDGEDGPDTYEWDIGAERPGRRAEASVGAESVALSELKHRVGKALDIAECYGQIDGDHHKAWAIDQMVQVLAGDQYGVFVASSPSWYKGTPP